MKDSYSLNITVVRCWAYRSIHVLIVHADLQTPTPEYVIMEVIVDKKIKVINIIYS